MASLKNTVRSKATAVGNAFSEKWLWSLTILVHSSHKFMLLLHSICFTLSKQYKCNLNIHHLNFPYIALKASLPFKQLHKTQSPFCNKAYSKIYLIPAGCSLSWLRIVATLLGALLVQLPNAWSAVKGEAVIYPLKANVAVGLYHWLWDFNDIPLHLAHDSLLVSL